MTAGAWALLAAVLVTAAVGLWHRGRQGRITRVRRKGDEVSTAHRTNLPAELADQLAARSDTAAVLTLLQFSTAFCAPCRHVRVLLSTVAESLPGVRHVEIDLTHRPEWSTPLRVHTTPTTLVLDSSNTELFRVSGVPRRDSLTEALRPHLPPAPH